MMKRQPPKTFLLFAALIVFVFIGLYDVQSQSPTAANYSADVAVAWLELQLDLVRDTPGYTPPVASRVFGYTGVTLYEAVVHGMPDHQSLVRQLNALTALPQPVAKHEYHWGMVANSALAEITRLFFPSASEEYQNAIDTLYQDFESAYSQSVNEGVLEHSADYGRNIAEAIYAWSMTDGGHNGQESNFPVDYVPLEGRGLWIPTPRFEGEPQPAMQPYWGFNRPFVLQSGETCMTAPPPEYSEDPESVFYLEVMEVYEASQMLTEDQRDIAVFWADDPGQTSTPPGHSISILTQILKQEQASLGFAAEAYARMGMAVADAFIGCWNAKYTFNLVRPVTVIQAQIDVNWMPIVNTPPFPEYPSGHSVQSGAASTIFIGLFGDDYTFTDNTHDDLGFRPRSYTSFTQMAEEAALSRLYGGIHYRAAIERGLEQGRCIGEHVNAVQFVRSN